tara:strand:+ start:65585 stop:66469 length:885 start_codon:yes stop_codon:yes gene_type:complete
MLVSSVACATTSRLYNGETSELVNVQDVVDQVAPGTVIILSEQHGFAPHHANQRQFLDLLGAKNFTISTGLEFFYYTDQSLVNDYMEGDLTEEAFLEEINWGSIPFSNYRYQARFPLAHDGFTLAINAPKEVTRQISSGGMDSLTEDQRDLLPPNFTLGNDLYRERFEEAMGGHVPAEKVNDYFISQSLWDDTMAWRVSQFMAENPEHVFVVIVGDFHASYFGGLPDRMTARGINDLLVISQVDARSADEKEFDELVAPHSEYGVRADFVWAVEPESRDISANTPAQQADTPLN